MSERVKLQPGQTAVLKSEHNGHEISVEFTVNPDGNTATSGIGDFEWNEEHRTWVKDTHIAVVVAMFDDGSLEAATTAGQEVTEHSGTWALKEEPE